MHDVTNVACICYILYVTEFIIDVINKIPPKPQWKSLLLLYCIILLNGNIKLYKKCLILLHVNILE